MPQRPAQRLACLAASGGQLMQHVGVEGLLLICQRKMDVAPEKMKKCPSAALAEVAMPFSEENRHRHTSHALRVRASRIQQPSMWMCQGIVEATLSACHQLCVSACHQARQKLHRKR